MDATTMCTPVANEDMLKTIADLNDDKSVLTGKSGAIPVTQDSVEDIDLAQDYDSSVQEAVVRQLERVAENNLEDDEFEKILSHEWNDNGLILHISWTTGETRMLPYIYCQRDYPHEVADYILKYNVGASHKNKRPGRYINWAKSYRREIRVAVRRLFCLERERIFQEDHMTDHNSTTDVDITNPTNIGQNIPLVNRRAKQSFHDDDKGKNTSEPTPKTKPGRTRRKIEIKYSVLIPTSVKESITFDTENGNSLWAEAIQAEIESLKRMKCFDFKAPNFNLTDDYTWTTLTLLFEIKEDERRKARLCAGGHLVDLTGMHSRSTVVSGLSVKIMDVIAHSRQYKILCGDISNAFITAPCMEKVYSRCGPEFGELMGCVVIIMKALYGLKSSARAFRPFLADYIRNIGFYPSRYDRDLWMRSQEENDGYDYVCTHVDDFKV